MEVKHSDVSSAVRRMRTGAPCGGTRAMTRRTLLVGCRGLTFTSFTQRQRSFYDTHTNDKEARRSVFSSFNNTFISMLCFVYKEFKTSVDED